MKNRSTSYESLQACLILLTTEDENVFAEAYKIAIHDKCGPSVWREIHKKYVYKKGKRTEKEKEYARKYYREYYRRQKNGQRRT